MKICILRCALTSFSLLLVFIVASVPRVRAVTPTAAFSPVQAFHQSIDGVEPASELTIDPSGNYYGTTFRGGTADAGTVFEVTPAGVESVFYDFAGSSGTHPQAGLVFSTSDGNFYGTTTQGGDHGAGTFFELTPAGVLTTLYSFTAVTDGNKPIGTLVQGLDGNLYGVCQDGGPSGRGTVFKMTKNGFITVLHAFGGFVGNNNTNDGQAPSAGLCKGLDENFYGVTAQGGPSGNAGVVFSITPDGTTYTLLHSFAVTDGSNPSGALLQVSSGVFLGVTIAGGANGAGAIYEVGSNLSFAKLYDFSPGTGDFSAPIGRLVKASDGLCYGIASGGASSSGGIYRTSPIVGGEATLGGFDMAPKPQDGVFTTAGLIIGSDGMLHGVVSGGGTNGQGFILSAPVGGLFGRVHDFFQGGNARSASGLVMGNTGTLFGTTASGGTSNKGTVFEFAGGKVLNTLYNFSGPDGATPSNGTLAILNGFLYGTTLAGGTNNLGTAYVLDQNGDHQTLHSFGNADVTGVLTDGAAPQAGLTAIGSIFYGVTLSGGTNNSGVFYEIPPTTPFTTLQTLQMNEGYDVQTALTLGGDGNFYATGANGGAFGVGAVFSFTPSGTQKLIHSFSATDGNNRNSDGAYPSASLVEGASRLFYGTTAGGGTNGNGTIFTVTPAGVFNTLYSFSALDPQHGTNADGLAPQGLVKGSDGNIYGCTPVGGPNANGTLFVITPGGTLTVLHTFPVLSAGSNLDGARPYAPLVETTPGTFFGTTKAGGTGGGGTIFSLTVSPAITSALSLSTVGGQPFNYQITATNSPTAFAADDLPAGLTLNAATGLISGTPTAGSYPFKIGAQNAGGFDDEAITLTVTVPPPEFTSPSTATAIIGQPFNYQITATNSPTSFGALGLPDGLTVNATGLISGTATTVGNAEVTLFVQNAGGVATEILIIFVVPAQQKPTVVLTSPPTDETVFAGADVPLAADVSDPDGVLTQVQFVLDGNVVATVTAAPFVADLKAPAPGVYPLSAIATDRFQRQSFSQRTLTTLASAFSEPTVKLLSGGADGRTVAASSTLTLDYTVTTSDPAAPLVEVDFYADDAKYASLDASGNPISSAAPVAARLVRQDAASGTSVFRVTFTLPGANSITSLIAVAIDKLGRSQVSKPIAVRALAAAVKPAPVVSVGLTDGAAVKTNQAVTVPVTATASSSLATVDYFVNGTMQKEDTQGPFGFSFTPSAAGLYVITAIATDASGLSTVSTPVRLNAAPPPVVSVKVKGSPEVVAGQSKGKLLVSRDSFLSEDLTVRYKLNGTAVNGVDYKELTGSVVIPAGAASAKITIKPIDGLPANGMRDVKIKLRGSTTGDYEINNAGKQATVSIIDDE